MSPGRFRWLASFSKISLSCSAAGLGVLIGFFCVAQIADEPVFPPNFRPAGIYVSRVLSIGVLGFVFLIGSLLALRRPRLASRSFLFAAPLMGLCIAWRMYADPFDPQRSVGQIACQFATASLLFVVPGLFWRLASHPGWPPLISFRARPTGQVRQSWLLETVLFGVFVIAGAFAPLWLSRFNPEGDCRLVRPPVSDHQFPNHTVFTARVVFVGWSARDWPDASWAVVRVERRFWGLPPWVPNYLILRGYFERGERREYFVDGRRCLGLITHFLPVVEPYPCCRMKPLDQAAVELRVLRDGPPKSGVRLIGRVNNEQSDAGEPVRGVQVSIAGPGGNIVTTTDHEGIYDVTGLPAGRYRIQVEPEDRRDDLWGRVESNVELGEVWETELVAGPA